MRARYAIGQIYTNIGDILLALNPFSSNHDLQEERYGVKTMEAYCSNDGPFPPHIFAISTQAYKNLLHTKNNQVLYLFRVNFVLETAPLLRNASFVKIL